MSRRKVSRTTYTLEKADTVIEMLESGKGAANAAKAVGVTRKTLYNWRDQNESFRARWDDTQEGVTDGIEETAIEKAMDGDTTLLIFLLKSRRRSVYRESMEHTGDASAPLTVVLRERSDGPA